MQPIDRCDICHDIKSFLVDSNITNTVVFCVKCDEIHQVVDGVYETSREELDSETEV